jgi:hypothetical protein
LKKILTTCTLALLALSSFAQVDPNRVVVTVNGEEIKGAEYYRRMEYLPGVGRRYGDRFAEFPPGFMTIEQLVTEKLVYQLAKSKGCLPSDQEIQTEFEKLKKETPKYVDQWIESGRLMDDLLNQLKYDLAQFKIVTNGIIVTDNEVKDFYKTHPDIFTIPKRVKLRVIVVDTEAKMADVDKALASGTPFADVAKTYSLDVTKVAGGEYGTVPLTNMTESVRKAIEETKITQTTKWISSDAKNSNYIKFLVEDILAEVLLPLDENAQRSTRRRMMLERGSKKNNIDAMMTEARKNAKVDIKQKDFADAYKKFIDNYLKQQEAKAGSK